MRRYHQGVVLTDWTRFAVSIESLSAEGKNWELLISTSDSELLGDYLIEDQSLALETIIIEANPEGVIQGDISFPASSSGEPFRLSQTPTRIAFGTAPAQFQIVITYKIGTEDEYKLLKQRPDYYTVELYFDLEEY